MALLLVLPNRLFFFCPVTIETDLNDSNHVLFIYFILFMQVHQATAEIFGPGFPRTGNTDPW